MEFSKRILEMQYSPIRKLVPYADVAKKEGVRVYELHIGQPDVQTPDTFFDGLHNYKEKIVKYANSADYQNFYLLFQNHINLLI